MGALRHRARPVVADRGRGARDQVNIDNTTKATTGVVRPLVLGTDFALELGTDAGAAGTLKIRPLKPLVPSTGATNNGYLVLVTNALRRQRRGRRCRHRLLDDQGRAAELRQHHQRLAERHLPPLTGAPRSAARRRLGGERHPVVQLLDGLGRRSVRGAGGHRAGAADRRAGHRPHHAPGQRRAAARPTSTSAPPPCPITCASPPARGTPRGADFHLGRRRGPGDPGLRSDQSLHHALQPGVGQDGRPADPCCWSPCRTAPQWRRRLHQTTRGLPAGDRAARLRWRSLAGARGRRTASPDACFVVAAIDLPLHGITSTTNPLYQAGRERTFNLDLVNNTTSAAGRTGDDRSSTLRPGCQPADHARQPPPGARRTSWCSPSRSRTSTSPATRCPDIDPARIHYVGLSLGGIVGSVATRFATGMRTRDTGGAGRTADAAVSRLADLRPEHQVWPRRAGPRRGHDALQQLLPATRRPRSTRGDPINHLAATVAAKPVHLIQVTGDTVVPNSATARLVTAANLRRIGSAGPNAVSCRQRRLGQLHRRLARHAVRPDREPAGHGRCSRRRCSSPPRRSRPAGRSS